MVKENSEGFCFGFGVTVGVFEIQRTTRFGKNVSNQGFGKCKGSEACVVLREDLQPTSACDLGWATDSETSGQKYVVPQRAWAMPGGGRCCYVW